MLQIVMSEYLYQTHPQRCHIQAQHRKPPANDNFNNAEYIPFDFVDNVATTITGSNVLATREANEPYPMDDPSITDYSSYGGYEAYLEYVSASVNSVWWTFTTPVDMVPGYMNVNLQTSGFDSQVAVYEGTTLLDLNKLAFNEDRDPNNSDYTSEVTFAISPDVTYYIQVDGYYGSTGSVVINMTKTSVGECSYSLPNDFATYGDGLLQGFAGTDYTDTYWIGENSGSTGPSSFAETMVMSDNGKYILIGGPRYGIERKFFVLERSGSGFVTHPINMTGILELTGLRREGDSITTSDPLNHQISRDGKLVSGVRTSGTVGQPNASAVWADGFSNPPTINTTSKNYYRWISDNGLYTMGYSSQTEMNRIDLNTNIIDVITGSTYFPQSANYCMDKFVGWSSIDPDERGVLFTRDENGNWSEQEGLIVAHNVDPEVDYPEVSDMSGDGTKLCGHDKYGYGMALYWDISLPPTGGYHQATVLPNPSDSGSYGKSGYALSISSDGTVIVGETEYGYPCFWSQKNNYSTCNLLQDFILDYTNGPSTGSATDGSTWTLGSYNTFGKFGTSAEGRHLVALAEKNATDFDSMVYASPTIEMSNYP